MRSETWILSTLLLGLGLTSARGDVHLVPTPGAPLEGKTVVLSAGHGLLRGSSGWRFQRSIVLGLREDIHTNEITIEYLQRYLVNAGAKLQGERATFTLTRVEPPAGDAWGWIELTP